MEAYPFVTRNLFKDDRSSQLLREALYDEKGRIRPQRFSVLINQALDIVNRDSQTFIDLDTPPEESATFEQIVKFLFSGKADSIQKSLKDECIEAGDLVLRESVRRAYRGIDKLAVLKPPLGLPGPSIKLPPPPVFVPGKGVREMEKVIETAFPALELTDEIYAQGLLELIFSFINLDDSVLDNPVQPQLYAQSLQKLLSGNYDSESKQIIDLAQTLIQNNSQSQQSPYTKQEIENVRKVL